VTTLAPVAGRRPVLRFVAVGASGFVFQMSVFWLLTEPLGLGHSLAATVATALALAYSFVLNRAWTFGATHRHMGAQAPKYALVSVGAIAANVGVLWLLVELAGAPKLPSEAIAACFQAPVSYLGNRLWTFA
jgi:putative flippase GtrA